MAFTKINKGQPDWHIPLNENFDGIADSSLLPESVVHKDSAIFENTVKIIAPNTGNGRLQFIQKEGFVGDLGLAIRNPEDNQTIASLVYNIDTKKWYTSDAGSLWGAANLPVVQGNWTAIVKGNGAAGTANITWQQCEFIRIGNMVKISCNVNLISLTGATGAFTIAGLPFVSRIESYGTTSNIVTIGTTPIKSSYVPSGQNVAHLTKSANTGVGDVITVSEIRQGEQYIRFNTTLFI